MTLLTLVRLIAVAASLLLMVPTAVLLAQVLAARTGRKTLPRAPLQARPRVAVLVPAHDEETHIAATLRSVKSQLLPGDRLLVVADNCGDGTAAVARAEGAAVVERTDAHHRGKGHALEFGLQALRADPPGVVVFIDADCRLHPGSLETLVHQSSVTERPAQALDLMHAQPSASLKTRIGEFAWAVKNHARPSGAMRMGWPCQLMGTGMAIPWALLSSRSLATGDIVEDVKLGLDLAREGSAPRFCPDALVTSWFPVGAAGQAAQRSRWEQGHLGTIARNAPGLIWQALRERNTELGASVLDLCVPPLAWLAMMLSLLLAATLALAWAGGGVWPLYLAMLTMAMLMAAVFTAWAKVGRGIVSIWELLTAPLYALTKLPIYVRQLFGRKSKWVRADRRE
jgi:cellulose synthase/poly-beta-1,6-N-acetylglucosamine synthase-like glycosyltransferase